MEENFDEGEDEGNDIEEVEDIWVEHEEGANLDDSNVVEDVKITFKEDKQIQTKRYYMVKKIMSYIYVN